MSMISIVISKFYSVVGALTGVVSGVLNFVFKQSHPSTRKPIPDSQRIKRISDRVDSITSRLDMLEKKDVGHDDLTGYCTVPPRDTDDLTCRVPYSPDKVIEFVHRDTIFFLSQPKCLVFRSEADAIKRGARPCGLAQQLSAQSGYMVHLDDVFND